MRGALSWKDFREMFFLQYFPRSEQQKYERKYHIIRQKDGELTGDFMKRFLRLAGFVGEKAGPPEEQAKHFKWALSTWILDGIVNTEFTDVAQVANAGRNMELLRERGGANNKRNRDGDRRVIIVVRGRTSRIGIGSTTVPPGLQVRRDIRTIPLLLHVRHVENLIRAGHVIELLELATLVVRLSIWLGIVLGKVETVMKEVGTTSEILRKDVILI
ncbi:hypothetical protein Tco_0969118 [Tanacetum coccineum]